MVIQVLSYFFVYAFLGWCLEVAYNAMTRGEYVNSGMLNGPWCPIYGFGVLGIIGFLEPVRDNLFGLFLGAVLITSALELVTGFILEKVFHHKWWDYSDRPFNLGGYICLLFSMVWGLASVILIERIHPLVVNLFKITPPTLAVFLISILVMLLFVDTVVTVNTILKLNHKLENMKELSLKIRDTSDDIGEALASGVLILAEAREDLEEKLQDTRADIRERLEASRFFDPDENPADRLDPEPEGGKKTDLPSGVPVFGETRLLNAFPHLVSKRYSQGLIRLKEIHRDNKVRMGKTAKNIKTRHSRHNRL